MSETNFNRDHRLIYDEIASEYAKNNSDSLSDLLLSFRTRASGTFSPGGRILDLGCGTGRDIIFFEDTGFRTVGVDLSFGMLGQADQGRRMPLVQGEMEALPFRNSSFDGVWSCFSILHTPKLTQISVLAEVNRILKPGGIMFLATISGDHPFEEEVAYRPGIIREYYPTSKEALTAAAKQVGLTVLEKHIINEASTRRGALLLAQLRQT